MFNIEQIVVSRFGSSVMTISDLSGQEITLRFSAEQANEIERVVREILATELRRPMIEKKMEEAKAVFSPPATIETSTGTAHFTPDGYKPDEDSKANEPGFKSCEVHGSYVGDECPFCDKPYPKPDKDIPF